MGVELIYLVNDEVRKTRTTASTLETTVRAHPDIKFYSINHNSPHKEWLIYVVHGGKVISYPALIKPVKLLTYLLLTDI